MTHSDGEQLPLFPEQPGGGYWEAMGRCMLGGPHPDGRRADESRRVAERGGPCGGRDEA